MPSLRKRVSSYFRQLSFHNEPRDRRQNVNENSFVTKYLQGHVTLKEGPPVIYGKNPTDLPNYELASYTNGPNTVIGCYSGPNGGLTTVRRTEKHLSLHDDDLDYIDTLDEEVILTNSPKKSPNKSCPGQPIDNTTMVIKVAGHEYCVINKAKRHSKSHSLGSIKDFKIEIEKTKIDKSLCSNNNCEKISNTHVAHRDKESKRECSRTSLTKKEVDLNVHKSIQQKRASAKKIKATKEDQQPHKDTALKRNDNYGLSKSKSEGNPFHHTKKGNIIKVERPNMRGDDTVKNSSAEDGDSLLPVEWNCKSDFIYGLSDSLYDRNEVTKTKNGDPIADCFGIIARNDSAILAVADGVNWGEKASIAAKSAVHGSLHYLNKTIFNDLKPFENLTIKTDESSTPVNNIPDEKVNLVSNTRELFVCLLRAFSCAHDLILENKGMLTTLTVAVVLPLKHKIERKARLSDEEEALESDIQYVCCVCNVGDTLAYVYSQKYGVREVTKGSHDINSNRDMRDALGALGPVDGINPELSNLTLSITTLQKGDIIMLASDGLTDNFDPNVCKFTINTKAGLQLSKKTNTMQSEAQMLTTKPVRIIETSAQKPPVKPPRKSKTKDTLSRDSADSSVKILGTNGSSSQSVKSTSAQDNCNNAASGHNSGFNKELQSGNEKISTVEGRNNDSGDSKDYRNPSINDNSSNSPTDEFDNPLITAFMQENSLEGSSKFSNANKTQSAVENRTNFHTAGQKGQHTAESSQNEKLVKPVRTSSKTLQTVQEKRDSPKKNDQGYKFMRSKTTIDMRAAHRKPIVRNEDGIPYITPVQRYELQLLLMEDILKKGISGKDTPCTSAKKLCENLVSYTKSITSAKRHTLEDPDHYFDNKNGVLVEVSNQEKKIRRKRGLEKVQNLPGKLDHVTVVAYNVGNYSY